MARQQYRDVFLWLCLLFLSGCEEPYAPFVSQGSNKFLVVNGFINASGTTTIALSYTQNIYDNANPEKEYGATVEIEVENGPVIPLAGVGGGVYAADNIALPLGTMCRLRISTLGAKEYVSDFVEVKASPPIENVSWKPKNDGIQIAVSTRDPQNETRYYSWVAEETWEFRAPYRSYLDYKDGTITYNPFKEDLYVC